MTVEREERCTASGMDGSARSAIEEPHAPRPLAMPEGPARPRARLAMQLRSVSITAALLLIRSYQAWVRPHLVGSCKFCPSCSDYAAEALQLHGLRRGVGLAIRRLARCHPFSAGGIDPVPAP